MTDIDFDPAKILKILEKHNVDFVVIGAMAGIFQGAGLERSVDMDIVAARGNANLELLAAALREMEARLRVPDPDEVVEVPLDARMLAGVSVMTLITRYGPFDVLFEPSGAPPYEDLRARSRKVTEFGITIRAAHIKDLIDMKRAAGRQKDAAHIVVLLDFLKQFPDEESG